MKRILFMLSAVACLGLAAGACSKKNEKKEPAAAPKGTEAAATSEPAESTPTPAPATPAAEATGDQAAPADLGVADLGVPSCTEYVQKMSKCLDDPKFPEQTREAAKKTLQQAVQQWKQLPEKARVGLGPACAKSLEKAKAAYEKVGCSF